MARNRRGAWRRWGVLAAAMALAPGAGRAAEKVETYADGTQKSVYTVTAEGLRSGPFKEFHPSGKLKTQGSHRSGKLTGPLKSFHANGRVKLRASYRDGQPAGPYLEHSEDGTLLRRANYRDGKRHGPQQEFAQGQPVKDEVWLDGQLLIPRSAEMIAAELAAIKKAPVEIVGQTPAGVSTEVQQALRNAKLHAQREAGLRALMAYRCICGLPYRDLKLDRTHTAHAQAAAQLMARTGQLEHRPPNPGMPNAEYRFALLGTISSCLSGHGSAALSVQAFMDDSDRSNIDRLAHRRWCLNPAMLKTGFGSLGNFTAMWGVDSSRTEIPDYDFVAFPPRGFVPTECFGENYAWSVSLNRKKYRPPDARAVKVLVSPARLNLRSGTLAKGPAALPLDYFNVSREPFGTAHCIIFRPRGVRVKAGTAYWVQIRGIADSSGGPAAVEYLVAFFAL